MKAKAFKKKLDINKSTVANLSQEKMGNMKGGTVATIHYTNCATCDILTPEPWCPPDFTAGPYTNCIVICPGTVTCPIP